MRKLLKEIPITQDKILNEVIKPLERQQSASTAIFNATQRNLQKINSVGPTQGPIGNTVNLLGGNTIRNNNSFNNLNSECRQQQPQNFLKKSTLFQNTINKKSPSLLNNMNTQPSAPNFRQIQQDFRDLKGSFAPAISSYNINQLVKLTQQKFIN